MKISAQGRYDPGVYIIEPGSLIDFPLVDCPVGTLYRLHNFSGRAVRIMPDSGSVNGARTFILGDEFSARFIFSGAAWFVTDKSGPDADASDTTSGSPSEK